MMPAAETLRILLFSLSAIYKLPAVSKARAAGRFRVADVARPPSPEKPPQLGVDSVSVHPLPAKVVIVPSGEILADAHITEVRDIEISGAVDCESCGRKQFCSRCGTAVA